MATGILYIAYDGMLEPLGQSQVLAYLEKLAIDRRIHLLSFDKLVNSARTRGNLSMQGDNTFGVQGD